MTNNCNITDLALNNNFFKDMVKYEYCLDSSNLNGLFNIISENLSIVECIKKSMEMKDSLVIFKLPEWGGFWCLHGSIIRVITKNGMMFNTPQHKYMVRDDWQILTLTKEAK